MSGGLALPPSWREEIGRRHQEHLRPHLVLTRSKHSVWNPAYTEIEVKYDLQEGAWLSRGRRDGDYEIGGMLFKLELRLRAARHAPGQTLAVIHRLSEFDGVPPTLRMKPTIEFALFADQRPSDLADLYQGLRRHEQSQKHLASPRRQPHLSYLADLNGSADREFRVLNTIFEVLSERSDRQEPWSSPGVVLPGGDLRIELESKCDAGPGMTVEVNADQRRTIRAQIAKTAGRTLSLNPVDDWTLRDGDEVVVERPIRFALRPNREAVRRFTQRQTEGDWQDLAALLFRPQSLSAPNSTFTPPDYFCDHDPDGKPLNERQREAVVKALSTPHAFLLQGPPGTGKTSVISELVRQFHRRGERVLLLAQSNVAVDEVLNRVGSKPGVQALRITYDESAVDPACHPYLFDRLEGDLTGRLRDGGASRRAIWDAKQSRLTALIENTESALAACASEQQAIERLQTAESLLARAKREEAEVLESAGYRLASQVRKEREISAESRAAHRTAAAVSEGHACWESEMLERAVRAHDALKTVMRLLDETEQARRRELVLRDQRAKTSSSVAHGEMVIEEWQRRSEAEWSDVNARTAKVQRLISMLQARPNRAGLRAWIDTKRLARAQRRLLELDARRTALADGDARAGQAVAVLNRERRELSALQGQILKSERVQETLKLEWSAATGVVRERLRELGCAPSSRAPSLRTIESARLECRAIASRIEVLWNETIPTDSKSAMTADWNFGPVWTEFGRRRNDVVQQRADAEDAQARSEEAQRLRVEYAAELAAAEEASARRIANAEAVTETASVQAEETISQRRDIAGDPRPNTAELRARLDAAIREHGRLESMARLRNRWDELLDANGVDEMVEDIRGSLVRGTNLVCGTTAGIVGGGSEPVRATDFDVLILDEASRVTHSEFLIGAVRCRRWILVGDEHQLPPHVDDETEQYLHALAALKHLHAGQAKDAAEAVEKINGPWNETDEDLRKLRVEQVIETMESLVDGGAWEEVYRDKVKRIKTGDLLKTMKTQMVKSLFEQVVEKAPSRVRTKLTVQRRMVPALSTVVRGPVYGGDYLDPPVDDLDVPSPIITPTFKAPAVFVDTSRYGRRSRDERHGSGMYSPLEARAVDWVLRTYDRELRDAGERAVSYGVLSFYKAQVARINRQAARFRPAVLEKKVVGSIDSLQGQQADIIVLSFVRSMDPRCAVSPQYGLWLQDLRRLNVACTRARRALVLVGHADTLRRLNGESRQRAQAFYEHLFGLFDAKSSDYQMIEKFEN